MASVHRGKFHASARQSNVRGWIIEIWQDGVQGPVDIIECARRPTYIDKKAALDALVGKKSGEEAKDWDSEAAAEDRQLREAYRRSLALQGERAAHHDQPVRHDSEGPQSLGVDHLQADEQEDG